MAIVAAKGAYRPGAGHLLDKQASCQWRQRGGRYDYGAATRGDGTSMAAAPNSRAPARVSSWPVHSIRKSLLRRSGTSRGAVEAVSVPLARVRSRKFGLRSGTPNTGHPGNRRLDGRDHPR